LREEDGQIVGNANFATAHKRPPHTYSTNVGTPFVYGRK
jgi:hypothetical protein